MTKTLLCVVLGLLSLGSAEMADEICGDALYDTTKYVCYDDHFLCPIRAGEALSLCGSACYSTYMYTCTNNALVQLPELAAGTPFALTASNPTVAAVDDLAVNACDLTLNVGGTTCSYCPADQIGSENCPPGDTTAITAGSAGSSFGMDTAVPGGQLIYLDNTWALRYTQAHSANMGSGYTVGGLVAYSGGGLVNLNGGDWGWFACSSTDGSSSSYKLYAANATSYASLSGCTQVNLKVDVLSSGTAAAWQYT